MRRTKRAGRPRDDADDAPLYLSPYEWWNFGPGKGYASPDIRRFWRYITALAEFEKPLPANISGRAAPVQGKPTSWFPTLWENASGLRFRPFVVYAPVRVESPDALRQLLLSGLGQLIPAGSKTTGPSLTVDIDKTRFRVAFPVPDCAMHPELKRPTRPGWYPDERVHKLGKTKRITVIGVIDDGLPFAHRNFRDLSGTRTRVEFCWLQSAERKEGKKSVLFGREYTRDQVEYYIREYGHDEDTLYRKAGATTDTEDLGSLIDRHATHGGHVMDLAAGYAPERGEDPAEEIRIIAVQLPNTIAWDTSGFGKDMYMLSAFHYIFDRADMIADGYQIDCPRLVINFSYGFSGGRHDGGTELEAAITEMIEKRRECRGPTALVLPAGNTFLDRLHGKIDERDFKHGVFEFPWRIQPNDRTPSYLELWFWQKFEPIGYSIALLDPWGRPTKLSDASGPPQNSMPVKPTPSNNAPGDPRRVCKVLNANLKPIGQLSSDSHRGTRWRVLVIMAPTEPENPWLPLAEPGQWTVVIRRSKSARLLDHPIHFWIQRSADPETLRSGGRQSYFDDLTDWRYTLEGDLNEKDTDSAFVRRFGSLNGLATGPRSLVVAGYRLGAGLGSPLAAARPSRYSSAGTRESDWPEKKVDCSSMSDRSRMLPGTIAAGVRSGSLSIVQGTSAAAPFVARQLATIFTTADDKTVANAEAGNYLSLLRGYWDPSGNNNLARARLGAVRIPPDWQPGVDVDLLGPTTRAPRSRGSPP